MELDTAMKCLGAVPELTGTLDIKLNTQVSLWPAFAAISSRTGYCPDSSHSRRAITSRRATFSFERSIMAVGSDDHKLLVPPSRAWRDVWHLWTVIIPRRSIAGRLVFGKVWRRHDGRRWVYKKFTEYNPSDRTR